ncbi:helix-turn-helix domain-containing protein [Cereibacter sphaeroides]|uniref:helix-turn-helix domain-containing protein n=1 Tax=Cereibacter sphaeroides TaxID=1063 RepID=UPI003B5C29B0
MEQRIGLPLLARTTRDVRPTEAGQWSCPRFTGHSGGCGLGCDELAGRAHFQP